MANREACELYIEQEIKAGLEGGKKPYSIGKELSVWIEKLFEVNIKPTTLEKKAERLQNNFPTNVGNKSNPTKSQSVTATKSPSLTNAGGKRKGSGRKMSQKTAWAKAEKMLKELIEFMSPNCEIEKASNTPDISEESKGNIISDINFLELYRDELL